MATNAAPDIENSTGMIVDGIFASEVWDSSGEVLDVAGCDISDMEQGRGVCNYEHRNDESVGATAQDVVGKIILARKIFKESDADDERQKMFWDKIKVPFIYGMVRLYDGAGHLGAQGLAAQIRDHVANQEPILVRFSIDGSTIEKAGNRLKYTLGRRVAMTIKPCNKTCDSGLVTDPNAPEGFEKKPSLAKKEHPLYARLGSSGDIEQVLPAQEVLLKAIKERLKAKQAPAAEWTSEDGLTIPRGGTPERKAWDAAYMKDLETQFGKGKTIKVKVSETQNLNGVRNYDRLALYRQMIAGKDKLPPVVVRRSAWGYDLVDGNHRQHAAKLGGLHELDAIDITEGQGAMPKAKLKKATTAGGGVGAPSGLTGGAALQREDVRKRVAAVVKAYDESKGSLKDFMKSQLPDVSDEYIDHFVDLAADLKTKLRKADTSQPPADRIAHFRQSTMRSAQDTTDDIWGTEHAHQGGKVTQPKAPGTTVGAVDDLDDEEEDSESTSVRGAKGPLSILGKPVTPNAHIKKGNLVFNEHTGELHTPHGTYKMYNPDADGDSGKHFRDVWHSPEVRKQHDYAVGNWIELNKAMKEGRLPEAVMATSVAFSQLSPNCLDAETEALTQRGWVKGFDLHKDDILLTKNPTTGALEWQGMIDLRLFPDYEGPLVHLKSRSFDFVTTPDHRWLVTTGRGKVTEKTSMTLALDNDQIHRTGSAFVGTDSVLSDDEAELLGWFVTDGFIRRPRASVGTKTPRVMLVQSPEANPEKCDRIQAVLEATGQDFSRYRFVKDRKYVWRLGKTLTDKLLVLAPERTLTTASLIKLSGTALRRLRDAMLLGDGSSWIGKEGWSPKETLVTGREEQADAFQALLVLTGSASAKVWRDMSGYEPKSDLLKNTPKCKGVFEVNVAQRKYARLSTGHRTEYTAKTPVWCPIVPNTFFIARRNGCITVSGNTPVPVHEMMYAHLLDTFKHKGFDIRDPRFGTPDVKNDWMARDTPHGYPDSSKPYFTDEINKLITNQSDSNLTGRAEGERSGFMLPNNKFDNMARYSLVHGHMVDLVARHGVDGRAAVAELMKGKSASKLWEAARKRATDAGKPDIGPYRGLHIPGLAPKTARFAYSMMGAGNSFVPDTHFSRHLFGLDKESDGSSIRLIRNKVLWNEKNSELLNAMDRWYYRNHPAVQLMLQHPKYGDYFKTNPEQAVFPAFWGHWLAISPHEKLMKRGGAKKASNQAASHRPLFEEVQRLLQDPNEKNRTVPARTVPIAKDPAPQAALTFGTGKVKKSEGKSGPLIDPRIAAGLLHSWMQEHGEVEALFRYYSQLLPLLMHQSPIAAGNDLLKAERLSVDLAVLADTLAKDEKGTRAQGPASQHAAVEADGREMANIWQKDMSPVTKPERPNQLPIQKDVSGSHSGQPQGSAIRPGVFTSSHGLPELNNTPEQQALIHGLDLGAPIARPAHASDPDDHINGRGSLWVKHPDGRLVFAKNDANSYKNGAVREVAYHNLARDFFGLGRYLPLTAMAKHPDGKSQWSFQLGVPGAEHTDLKSARQKGILKALGDRGELHKLALMNHVLGNGDRHLNNYLFTEDGLQLIDHGHTFADPFHRGLRVPAYLERYEKHNPHGRTLHPAAADWLRNLDPAKLQAHAEAMNLGDRVPKGLARALEAYKQKWLTADPNAQVLPRPINWNGGTYL